MTRRGRKTQGGFSLIEVLVALTLFSLVSAGVTSFATSSMRRTAANRASAGAVIAGQQEIEDQRGLDYVDIASRTYSTTVGSLSYNVNTVVQNNTPANGMKQLTVTVTWTGPMGSQNHVLRTILTQITT